MPTTRSQQQKRELATATQAAKDKETVAVIGTGWAGWTLGQELSDSKFDIVLISPGRTVALTPLLASAACGIFDFRNAEEPVRRRDQAMRKYQAVVESVDFDGGMLKCKSTIPSQDETRFEVPYDKLVICPGCDVNDFGTPGVEEHSFYMKTVPDAMKMRARILDMFEAASLPTLSEQERKDVLRVIIVGGGPTGVAIAAEVDDLVNDHLFAIYPHLRGLVSLDIYDVAPQILSPFDEKLGEHALESFHRRNVGIKTSKHIEKVEKDCMYVKEDGKVPFGMLVWATGNKQVGLIDSMDVKKSEKLPRLLTDKHLHLLHKDSRPFDNVYALGDAADIEGSELPTTAEVAVQKAKYLAHTLNTETAKPFAYEQKALVAYIGGGDGVIAGKQDWTGASAYLAWRSGTLQWSRSWRRRFMIVMNWFMNWLDGRELARKS